MATGQNDPITDADLAELIARVDEAAAAFIRGDARTYLALLEHSDDYTLMPPGGGPTIHGSEGTDEAIDAVSAFFAGPGEATWVTEATYVSGDMVVLVGVERQSGVIDGREPQDWSLRLTLVFRRHADGWQIIHRHADALVHPIPFDHVAEVARGLDS
ncbi:nuclear transport factor 2 family protein [Gordonia sp. NPDC003585]|uniref:YybH family protein n=1 Tax=Gordonia sp. NPDC003585 TaxID=3154275 RepID=UPI0033B30B85